MIKNQPVSAGDIRDTGSVPELGRFPGGENGNPLQYSCSENTMERGSLQSTVHRVTKSQTQLRQLSTSEKNITLCLSTCISSLFVFNIT